MIPAFYRDVLQSFNKAHTDVNLTELLMLHDRTPPTDEDWEIVPIPTMDELPEKVKSYQPTEFQVGKIDTQNYFFKSVLQATVEEQNSTCYLIQIPSKDLEVLLQAMRRSNWDNGKNMAVLEKDPYIPCPYTDADRSNRWVSSDVELIISANCYSWLFADSRSQRGLFAKYSLQWGQMMAKADAAA